MKIKYILWSMVCLLTACSQDETRQEEPNVALQVSTEMSTTRGVITGTSFAKGDDIAVVVVKQNGNLYEENRYCDFYEYDGTDWKNSPSWRSDLMLNSEEGVVYACYPIDDGNWIKRGCWVSVSPSWSGEQDDYLYGKSIENVSCKNPKARLRFQFALARLTFQIILGGATASAQVLTSAKLSGSKSIATLGTMDVKTGDITNLNHDASITLPVNKTLGAIGATQVDFLVIPTTTYGDATLTLTINGTDYDISIPAATWEKGKQYTYPVTVNIGSQQQQSQQTFTINDVSFTMVRVEGGTFQMGATSEQQDPNDSEKPVHQVTLSSYFIGETEVTQALWQAVMGSNPSYFKGEQRPVETVSWDDCQTFIQKLNQLTGQKFRLPTEAEWEYAARGGNKSRGYEYSGSDTLGDVAWYYDNSKFTHDVKTKLPNELGLYDMSGNVIEWCQDWYGSYSADSQTNPTGPSSGYCHVARGGGYYNNTKCCRVAFRDGGDDMEPDYHGEGLGLRLALQ